MYQLITSRTEIQKLHKQFLHKVVEITDQEVKCKLFVYWGEVEAYVQYSKQLKIWAYVSEEPIENSRYGNAFGRTTSLPREGQSLSIIVEINYPIEGKDWSIAAFWAINSKTGKYHLFHQGKIGGSMKGVSQEGFFNYWEGHVHNLLFDRKSIKCVEVCVLGSTNFSERLQSFIKAVYKIKQQIKDPTIKFV